jgi:Ca2+-binding EF-hand superfamily protein
MRSVLTSLVALCAAGFAAAQSPPPSRGGKPAAARPPEQRVVRGDCSEAQSRNLFAGCDADGDDRLDLFEAATAIDAVRGVRDLDGFARFDVDRDGFIGWGEFDRVLRTTLDSGLPFRVNVVRPGAPATTEVKPLAAPPALLQEHDADGDGALDANEVAAALRRVDARLATWSAELLRALDLNRDGKLQAAELAPAPRSAPPPPPSATAAVRSGS